MLHALVVLDVQLGDRAAHLRHDADDVGRHDRVVRLRVPHHPSDDHDTENDGSRDDADADEPSQSVACRSLISAPEQEEPRGEDPQTGEARVHEGRRTEVRRDLRRDEHLPDQHREHDPGDDADQPRREERAQDVDGRRQKRQAATGIRWVSTTISARPLRRRRESNSAFPNRAFSSLLANLVGPFDIVVADRPQVTHLGHSLCHGTPAAINSPASVRFRSALELHDDSGS